MQKGLKYTKSHIKPIVHTQNESNLKNENSLINIINSYSISSNSNTMEKRPSSSFSKSSSSNNSIIQIKKDEKNIRKKILRKDNSSSILSSSPLTPPETVKHKNMKIGIKFNLEEEKVENNKKEFITHYHRKKNTDESKDNQVNIKIDSFEKKVEEIIKENILLKQTIEKKDNQINDLITQFKSFKRELCVKSSNNDLIKKQDLSKGKFNKISTNKLNSSFSNNIKEQTRVNSVMKDNINNKDKIKIINKPATISKIFALPKSNTKLQQVFQSKLQNNK